MTEDRLCLIVPGGDDFENIREGRTVRCIKDTTFYLLIADRDWAAQGNEAVFGGGDSVGILNMQERIVSHFAADPQIGLPYVILQPSAIRPIELPDDDVKDTPGRECFVISYDTPAGEQTMHPTKPWAP